MRTAPRHWNTAQAALTRSSTKVDLKPKVNFKSSNSRRRALPHPVEKRISCDRILTVPVSPSRKVSPPSCSEQGTLAGTSDARCSLNLPVHHPGLGPPQRIRSVLHHPRRHRDQGCAAGNSCALPRKLVRLPEGKSRARLLPEARCRVRLHHGLRGFRSVLPSSQLRPAGRGAPPARFSPWGGSRSGICGFRCEGADFLVRFRAKFEVGVDLLQETLFPFLDWRSSDSAYWAGQVRTRGLQTIDQSRWEGWCVSCGASSLPCPTSAYRLYIVHRL